MDSYVLYLVYQLKTDIYTMKHKTIAQQSAQLLAYFNQRRQPCFTHAEAVKLYPRTRQGTVSELLSDMTRRGLLMRLKKGLYYIIPYEHDPDTFLPNWHLLASYLLTHAQQQKVKYYIGYYSALEIHSLITQPALTEQIVVAKQVKPSTLTIKDVQFQFIYHNSRHFFGITPTWVDDFTKIPCSNLEKTLIDCLFNPKNAGGIVEVAKALYNAQDMIDYERLLQYVERFHSQAVIKRLGFLLDLLDIRPNITEQLYQLKTPSFTSLDPSLPREGNMHSKWSIQVNADTETIRSSVLT